MLKRRMRWLGVGLLVALCICRVPVSTYAQTSSSTNFRFDESELGNGGMIQSNSTNYQFGSSIGDTGVGNSESTNFQVEAGSKTTDDPALTFIVNSAPNFSDFSAAATATTTSTFTIINYTSYGYIVQIAGTTPSNGAHTIPGMASTAPPAIGTEQFGINLVANTTPSSLGANPVYGPFGLGSATPNYGVSNEYRYVSGETIASAPKSSGDTTYTISYIVNASALTPGGVYTAHQELVCTGTY